MTAGIRVLAAIGAANALVACMHFGLAAAGPQLRAGLDLDEAGLGLLLSGIPAGLMLGTFAWGELADRIGERRALVSAYLLLVASFLAAGVLARRAWEQQPSDELVVLLGLALLAAGAAGSAAHSAGGRAITEAFPVHVHARVLAIRHTLIPVGGTIGGVLVPWLLHRTTLAAVLGGAAVAGAVVALGLRMGLPGTERSGAGASDLAARQTAAPRRGGSPLASAQLWLLGGSCSMLALVQLALVSFLTLHLVDEAGFGLAAAAALFSAAQLAGATARIALGAVADRSGDPGAVLLAVTVVVGALLVAALLVPSSAAGVLLATALLVATSWNGVAVAAAARLAPRGRTGATLGMQTTMFATMGVVAPIVTGIVLGGAGWTPVLIFAAGAMVVAAVGLAVLRPRLRRVEPVGSG